MKTFLKYIVLLCFIISISSGKDSETKSLPDPFDKAVLTELLISSYTTAEIHRGVLFKLRRNETALLNKYFPENWFLLANKGHDLIHMGFHSAAIAIPPGQEAFFLYSLADAAKFVSSQRLSVADKAAAIEVKDLLLDIVGCTPIKTKNDLLIDGIKKSTLDKISTYNGWEENIRRTEDGWQITCIYYVDIDRHPLIEQTKFSVSSSGVVEILSTSVVHQSLYIVESHNKCLEQTA